VALATIARRFRGWRRAPLVLGAVPAAAAVVAVALSARPEKTVEQSGVASSGTPPGELAVESAQHRLQRDVEEHLRAKATSLLERVVGERQAVVEVHADLDFERVERSVETWDPASRVLRSEQVAGEDGAILTSYEIDRTAAKVVGAAGAVRRLSIAVLVNGVHEKQADGTLVWVERTPRELETLSAIVRDAVGWDESRGDTLEMASLRFAEPPVAAPPPSLVEIAIRAIGLVALVAVAAFGALAIRDAVVTKRPRRARPVAPAPVRTDEPPRRSSGRERIHALARERPVEVAQVLRGWLGEERST
jgi:flagellar M-ring protein FliF